MKTYYITTPIYYVNDAPHIGHAYTSVAADAIARFMRLDGYRVHFLTGTDEHGQKVEKSAQAAGLDPQTFCDRMSQSFRDMTSLMNISNDDFIRTTEPRHIRSCQTFWREIAASKTPKGRDNIYLDKYAGWYAVRDEAFYGEDELITSADGERRAPSGAKVEWVEEPSYFFRLSDWQDWLLDHIERNPDAVAPPARRHEVMNFVKSGLRDLSISRTSFTWGVPVPGDPQHIMYVWFDALINYITAVGYPNTGSTEFTSFWPASLHVVGKDIVRFHCVYWPAFLKAASLAPQQRTFGHGWWTVEGQKMSKSLGNFIPPKQLVEQYGLDPVRYFLLRELPFGSDGDFSRRAVVDRVNRDLANDFGNLAQRVLAMIERYCNSSLPHPGLINLVDTSLLSAAAGLLDSLREDFAAQTLQGALRRLWEVIGLANRYVDEQAPWRLPEEDPERLRTVLYVLAEMLRHAGVLAQPIVPTAAAHLLDQLAVPHDERNFAALSCAPLVPGTRLPKPKAIFPRIIESVNPIPRAL